MRRYITREDAVFAVCKVLDKFGGCKMGPFCPDAGCREVRDIIDTFPMIEIPEKHGRLIDADALKRELVLDYAYSAADMVDDAPTIIPASEEGET